MKEKEKTYPVLNIENQDDNRATFMDIEVDVEENQLKTKVYNKREKYKSEIVNSPDLSANTPNGAAYGVYTSQVIRYARVCNTAEERVKPLSNTLLEKNHHQSLKTRWRDTLGSITGLQTNILAMYNPYWGRKYQYNIMNISLQHLPSTRWQKLLGLAALNNSHWYRPRNELRLSADDGVR